MPPRAAESRKFRSLLVGSGDERRVISRSLATEHCEESSFVEPAAVSAGGRYGDGWRKIAARSTASGR
jgi:hypothetical protein